jgi:hypothetical protein
VFYGCWTGQNSSLLRKRGATPPYKLGPGFGSASR